MKVYSQLKVPTLLAASLSCLMLAGCGPDSKPTLPDTHATDNGKTDGGKTDGGKEDTKKNKDITFRLGNQSHSKTEFIDGKVTLYANSTNTECSHDSETCGAIKFSTTLDEFQILPEITKEKPATVKYKLSSPQGDVADLLKDPSQVTGTITIHADPTPEKITPFGPPSPLVTIPLKEDAKNTGNWVVTVTLMDATNPLAEAKIANTLEYVVVNQPKPAALPITAVHDANINDTGVTFAGINPKGNELATNCTTTTKQDCNTGRDAKYPPNDANNANGWAGFDFTKLDKDGKDLAADATDWSCVRDNVTGKVWERKTYAPQLEGDTPEERNKNKDYRDVQWSYNYYDTKTGLGFEEGGWKQYETHCGLNTLNDKGEIDDNCTTELYTKLVNEKKLCGMTGWRLPSRNELYGIMNLNAMTSAERLNADWFFSSNEKLPFTIWTSSVAPAYQAVTPGDYSGPKEYKFNHVWTISSDTQLAPSNPDSSYSTSTTLLVNDNK